MSLGGIVHPQVVADLADDDLTGVEPEAHCEAEAALALQLLPEAVELTEEVEGRVAGAVSMVLMGDRRAEERHHTVAGILIDRALEAVHAFRQDLEEAVEDHVPLLGIDLLGELHRAGDVDEEHGHLLALALEGRPRAQDLVLDVLRRIGARVAPGWLEP